MFAQKAGAYAARRKNEQRLYISAQQENAAILSGLGEASAQGATQVAALIAREKIERAIGDDVPQEVASGAVGPGCTANLVGRAVGAFATSSGSCPERLAKAAQAAGEGAAVQAAGTALAQAGIPLCPTTLINEEGRKGMEFAGGSMVSVGQRDRYGSGQLEDGTTVTRSAHEEGVQLRAGGSLSLCSQSSQYCPCLFILSGDRGQVWEQCSGRLGVQVLCSPDWPARWASLAMWA